ncbi:toprim domain-containing protein [Archaeoglobus veneficus]|uniref:UPF0292 protein Arcve_1934 n=1 Tax=Archaeoglobus veneficus (strain DSM 11195 / SNP6) TaxID=693661 RepID=F2KRR3_ARCVS|nr:toprim domain-containing protein [Archaeoglobus veneficus]AEA47927.1 TOPRIM domain-containing protein [Archaeoglobus veneficus SNP6]
MNLEEFFEFVEIIDELRVRAEEGAVIIVEGSKDVEALRELGVQGEILKASALPTPLIVDEVGAREVIILTDWDRRGEILEKDLVRKFSSWGITPDVRIRKRLFALISKEITSIENLSAYYFRVRDELGRKRI